MSSAPNTITWRHDEQPGNLAIVTVEGDLVNPAHEIFTLIGKLCRRAGGTVILDLSQVKMMTASCTERVGSFVAFDGFKVVGGAGVAGELKRAQITGYPSAKSAQLALTGEATTKRILQFVQDLPALNSDVYQLLATLNDPATSFGQIEESIARHPQISAQIMRLVNSSWFSRGARTETLHQAMVRLGMDGIRQVLIYDLYHSVQYNLKVTREVLNHGRHCAVLAGAIAERAKPAADVVGKVKLAGLLHDIGSQVLAAFMPDAYKQVDDMMRIQQVPSYVAELLVFGTEHQSLGKLLAQRWNFPDYLAQAIGDHHHLKGTNWDRLTLPVSCANEYLNEARGFPFAPYYHRLVGYYTLYRMDTPWQDVAAEFKAVIDAAEKNTDDGYSDQ